MSEEEKLSPVQFSYVFWAVVLGWFGGVLTVLIWQSHFGRVPLRSEAGPVPSAAPSWFKSEIWEESHAGGLPNQFRDVWLMCRGCVLRAESDSDIFACVQIKLALCRASGARSNPDSVQFPKAMSRFGSDTCACGEGL